MQLDEFANRLKKLYKKSIKLFEKFKQKNNIKIQKHSIKKSRGK
jgi:hypothetical protein